MLKSLLVGFTLAIVTIAIHAVGTTSLISYLRDREESFKQTFGEIRALVIAALGLMFIHLAEIAVWAIAYWTLVGSNSFERFEDALYFSTVTFTTLGYGDIVIGNSWKLLSACQGMIGLMVFGWSTALLFAVVQRIWREKLTGERRS